MALCCGVLRLVCYGCGVRICIVAFSVVLCTVVCVWFDFRVMSCSLCLVCLVCHVVLLCCVGVCCCVV